MRAQDIPESTIQDIASRVQHAVRDSLSDLLSEVTRMSQASIKGSTQLEMLLPEIKAARDVVPMLAELKDRVWRGEQESAANRNSIAARSLEDAAKFASVNAGLDEIRRAFQKMAQDFSDVERRAEEAQRRAMEASNELAHVVSLFNSAMDELRGESTERKAAEIVAARRRASRGKDEPRDDDEHDPGDDTDPGDPPKGGHGKKVGAVTGIAAVGALVLENWGTIWEWIKAHWHWRRTREERARLDKRVETSVGL